MRILGWSLVLLFGFSMTIIGLALPLIPGLPWLGVVSVALNKMCPTWWHRRWLYRQCEKVERKLKALF